MSENRSVKKRILAAAAACALLVTLPLSGCNKDNGNSESSAESSASKSVKETKFGNNVVVKSNTYQLKFPIVQYVYNNLYSRFMSSYGTYYIDSTKSLREQYVNQSDSTQTWHDYFVDYTKKYLTQTLIFAEEGKANGTEITKYNKEDIQAGFDSLQADADKYKVSFDEYIESQFGEGVTKEELEELLTLTYTAQAYSNTLNESFSYTDEDYENYYKENSTKYKYADYISYSFSYSTINDDNTSMIVDEEKKKTVKEYADALAQCKTKKDFSEYIKKYLKANPSQVSITTTSEEASVTEDDFNQAIENQVESAYHEYTAYSDSTELLKWVFDDSRKDGETSVVDTGNAYTAVLLVKAPYRDENITRDVRHILIKTNENPTDGSDPVTDEQAKEKAQKIYDEWKAGAATEDSFAELAETYTEDTSSKRKGGLYTNVKKHQMVAEFNDWVFDNSRKGGDTDIIKTSYGYHIMYFVKVSQPAWKAAVDSDLRERDSAKKYDDEMSKKYTVEFDDDKMNEIDVVEPKRYSEPEESSEEPSESSAESSVESAAEESKKSDESSSAE